MAIDILNRYSPFNVLATIAGSTLAGVNFSGLNLTNANLSNVDLTNSVFTGANVSGATFANSNCSGTDFFRANVEGADFRGITKTATSCFLCCFFLNCLIDYEAPVILTFESGQSNEIGTDSGPTPGLPDASIPFYFNQIGTVDTGAFVPLQINPASGNHGAEYTYGLEIKSDGHDQAILKLGRGSTTMSDWVPGQPNYEALAASFRDAMLELKTLYGGRFFRNVFCWYLGEDDARALSGGITYGANFLLFQAGIAGLAAYPTWKRFHTVLTPNWLALAKPTALYSVNYWQTLYSGWTINVDSLPRKGDDVHLTAAGEDALGLLRYASVLLQLAETWP